MKIGRLVVIVAVAVGGFLLWKSPRRKILGKWEMASPPLVSRIVDFSWDGKCTISTSAGVLNAAVKTTQEMSYKIDSSHEPWTLEFIPSAALQPSEKVGFRFVDSDTMAVNHTVGGSVLNFTLSSEWHRVK